MTIPDFCRNPTNNNFALCYQPQGCAASQVRVPPEPIVDPCYADPECFIDRMTKGVMPKPHGLEHSKLCVAIHEQGTKNFKADKRIRDFLQFGHFEPPSYEEQITLKMFFELNKDECGGDNEASFNLCREGYCSYNDCRGEAETYENFLAKQ